MSDPILGGAACPEAPQTTGSALRQFDHQISALKKQDKLAGQIERELAQNSKTLLREAARETLQARADATPPRCPVCHAPLEKVETKERTILTQRSGAT